MMGPIEQSVRNVLDTEADLMVKATGIEKSSPRFAMANFCALTELYASHRDSKHGKVSEEVAQDYLNAAYAILSAQSVAALEES